MNEKHESIKIIKEIFPLEFEGSGGLSVAGIKELETAYSLLQDAKTNVSFRWEDYPDDVLREFAKIALDYRQTPYDSASLLELVYQQCENGCGKDISMLPNAMDFTLDPPDPVWCLDCYSHLQS